MFLYYKVDEHDRVIEVGGDWDRSAVDNGSDECVSKYVIGADLFSYISGDHAKMWLRSIIQTVRRTKVTEIRTYRCDTPCFRREFLQTVSTDDHSNVMVLHELVREEKMPFSVRIQPAHDEMQRVIRCSICNKIKKDGAWIDPFNLLKDIEFRVIYSVCSACRLGSGKATLNEEGAASQGK